MTTNTYYTDGCHFRRVISETSFISVMPGKWGPCIDVRNYQSGIKDSFDERWKPCTQDAFIAAYCETINMISQASGIEHLPLLFDTTQNPES
jgi:hypothetical protein